MLGHYSVDTSSKALAADEEKAAKPVAEVGYDPRLGWMHRITPSGVNHEKAVESRIASV